MKTFGQIAYEAYAARTQFRSLVSGAPLPEWPAVKAEIQEAWEAAGEHVAGVAVIRCGLASLETRTAGTT